MSLSPFTRSPLLLVDEAVHRLGQSPGRFAINPGELGLPTIPAHPEGLSVLQVRDILSRPATPIAVKNQAWAALIVRAQQDKPEWTLAALGIALPRLRRISRELAHGYRGCPPDLDAEILTGFLTALAHAHTDRQQRFPALIRAARSAGLAWTHHCRPTTAAATPTHPLTTGPSDVATDPPASNTTSDTTANSPVRHTVNDSARNTGAAAAAASGHPDLVLADAVAAGILTTTEAEIIAATRLEHRPLRAVAAAHRVSVNTLWMRRDRAEKRLVTALTRAIAADDTDRATDPTHAHLLATTPLGQRLDQQIDQPAAQPEPTRHCMTQPTPTQANPTKPNPAKPGPPAYRRAHVCDRNHQPALTAPADMPTTETVAQPNPRPATSTGHSNHGHAEHGHVEHRHVEHRRGIEQATACGHAHRGRPHTGHRPLERPDHTPRPSGDQPGPEPSLPDTAYTPAGGDAVRGRASHVPSSARSHAHRTTGTRAYPRPDPRRPDTPTADRYRRRRFPPVTALLVAAALTIPMLVTGGHNPGHPASNPPTARTPQPGATSAAFTGTPITPTGLESRTTTFPATFPATTAHTPRLIPGSPAPSGTARDARPGSRAQSKQRAALPAARPIALPVELSAGLAPAQGTPDGTAQLTRVLTNIRNWLMGVLITLATLCLTVGGVRYLIAGGDPGEVEAAKRAIKSAAIGYALAALAPALVAVLRNLVGV